MFTGLLTSRVLLSISTMAFGLNALIGINPRRWFSEKWWLVSAGFVGYFTLSYFWSNDVTYWAANVIVKLPILLLPLSFAFLPSFSRRQYNIFTVFVAMLLVASVCYSVSFLFGNLAFYKEQYRTARVLPTPMKNDYIRFGLVIALYIMWSIYHWPLSGQNKLLKWFVGIANVVFVIYLHILASKSALIAIYIFFITWGIYILAIKKSIKGAVVIGLIILLFIFANKYILTFRERLGYVNYQIWVYQTGDKTGRYEEMGRIVSYDIAINIIKEHFLYGVGAGDMLHEMIKGYDKLYPNVPPNEKLLPHNEFLIVLLACGLPAMLIFILWVFMPLFLMKKTRESFFFLLCWVVLFIQLLIEPVLEVQYGVFVYMFFLLWQRHTLIKHEISNKWYSKIAIA